jgi:excisionase family DNA binding protein
MKEQTNPNLQSTPILFPLHPEQFWKNLRDIMREEISKFSRTTDAAPSFETPGLNNKPIYKMNEVCSLFQVTKPTIYEWIKLGKLKPVKIRSRVYFLWQDLQSLINPR